MSVNNFIMLIWEVLRVRNLLGNDTKQQLTPLSRNCMSVLGGFEYDNSNDLVQPCVKDLVHHAAGENNAFSAACPPQKL